MTTLASSDGRSIRLGAKLGTGGEGAVFRVEGHPNLVAKLYHEAVSDEKAAKLAAMASLMTESLRRVAAWPEATLHAGRGRPSGFLMRQIVDHRDIHYLYGPRTRVREYPQASYRFLIAVASNVARSFAVVHQHGHVIGDVNQGGVHVAIRDATVSLVDCDSFQVNHNGRLFGCEVGIPAFQPPELQSISSYRGVTRTANHDCFGLAVLIFHTLFLGRHPFAGSYLGNGEMSLERAIAEFRFPYARDAARRDMGQPVLSLGLGAVSPALAALFERAFLEHGKQSRPSALEWVGALDAFASEAVDCSANASHAHKRDAKQCPLCNIESRSGLLLFVPPSRAAATTTIRLDELWRDFTACVHASQVPAPHEVVGSVVLMRLPDSPIPARVRAQRAATALQEAKDHRARIMMEMDDSPRKLRVYAAWRLPVILGCIAWVVLTAAISVGVSPYFSLLAFGAVFGVRQYSRSRPRGMDELRSQWQAADVSVGRASAYKSETDNEAERAEQLVSAVEDAQHRLAALMAEVATLAQSATVSQLLVLEKSGRELHENLRGFDARRVDALRAFESTRNERQLTRHMESYEIASSGVKGIGSRLLATLVAYGIETALDVERSRLEQVKGFGPTRINALVTWREDVRRRFQMNPHDPVDAKERANLEAVLNQQQTARVKDLHDCFTMYKQLSGPIRSRLEEHRLSGQTCRADFERARERAIDVQALT